MKKIADIAVVGLAVMGENLVLNMENKRYTVAVYNRTLSKVDAFLQGRAKGKNIIGVHSLQELAKAVRRPRKIMLMIKAGNAVDSFIEQIIAYLEPGDIVIDGGNSHFNDTIRRTDYMESKGMYFIGAGISGGEQGALHGPSIMPGGSRKAWPELKPVLQAIAAKLEDGTPCCDWIGAGGAGHFVKMVHNGIEYGDMELIAEAYQLMRELLGMDADEMHMVFDEWNKGELESYLIEITGSILKFKDADGLPLVEKIQDRAGQKGTGKWAASAALEQGIPLTLITEAVFSRCLSALKQERIAAAKLLSGPKAAFKGNKTKFVNNVKQALYASKIISYTQGYALMRAAASEYKWQLDYGNIALIWRNGCIIRSAFLEKIKHAYTHNPHLTNLLLDPFFKEKVVSAQSSLRGVVAAALTEGVPVPAFAAALCYFDGYRSVRLPANLIQAQRDYFGAHTYERIDKPEGQFFHTDWTGKGGSTASSVIAQIGNCR
jgi:6-phosphogluconate dehydrogenase